MEFCGQFHAPAPLPQQKSPRYLSKSRVSAPRSPCGRFGEEKTVRPAGKRKSFLGCPVITLNMLSHDRVQHVKRGRGFHMLTEPVVSISGV
jgi:hypothetical protein